MKKLFGTDGIRAVAGQYPLDAPTIHAIGVALAHSLSATTPSPRVLLGMDTRESGSWIAATLTAGLFSAGASVESAGVITTPAIAFLTRAHSFSAGVVISASHNPWQDNGIKIFGPDGYKLPDRTELEIEEEIFTQLNSSATAPEMSDTSSLPGNATLRDDYASWLARSISSGGPIKTVVDCANGAASNLAPQVFRQCGISADFIHNS